MRVAEHADPSGQPDADAGRLMTVWVEVWPVVADDSSIWSISGAGPWRSPGVLRGGGDPHTVVKSVLQEHGVHEVVLLHSTSWRVDEADVVLTYLAVLESPFLAPRLGPALALDRDLVERVGRPAQHGPTDHAQPRLVDVLVHGIRHLAFLAGTDSTARAALGMIWRRHLVPLQPALAGRYER